MSSNPPEFDWAQAAALLGRENETVPEEMVEIVHDLIDSARLSLREMRQLDPLTEVPAITAQAHKLRGGLVNFGFSAPNALLQKLEKGEVPAAVYLPFLNEVGGTLETSWQQLLARYPSLQKP